MTRLFAGTPFDIPPRCDVCDELESECQCTAAEKAEIERRQKIDAARLPPGEQTARVSLQKRKGNRSATVIEGLSAAANDLPQLLGKLQAACGSGGTTKPKLDLVELQGDHVAKVKEVLKSIGYNVVPK